MSVYLAAVQLRMSGFEVRTFCERSPRAARHTVRPVRGKDGFLRHEARRHCPPTSVPLLLPHLDLTVLTRLTARPRVQTRDH